ncbi:MAG: hypothetical protein A2W25_01930 [candidate division Zixibacteria bacterium RBG_16_53_22]|nr:MAG: hypothetical protein A2W25_01930 [candidate division Zixibacteria bacterium RBG_16_53_22]
MTGDSVYFASWGFTDSSGYQPLYFVMSPDLGQTWSQLRVIAYSDQFLNNLRIQKCEGVLYAAWSAVPYPNGTMFEAVAIISPDGGQSWSDPIQLSSADAWPAQHTCIACEQESGNAVIGWVDSGESHSFPGDLYLRITSDGGASWGNEIRATHHHKVANPSLAFAGDSLWVVWSDWDSQYGPLNFEICFSKSIDLGLSWTPYERLTYAEGYSYTPWISYDVGNLHLVWEDQRPSSQYSDIYYKSWHYQVGVLDIGSSSAPMALSVFPNPFNTAVTVAISSYIQGQLVIYDLLGNRVRTFPVNSGKHRVVWEGRGQDGKILASGVYIACLRGGDRMITTKLVMIR